MRRRRLRKDRSCHARGVQGSWRTASRSPCWRRPRCWRFSIWKRSGGGFAAFPMRIEMLSRFRTDKEQKKTLGGAGSRESGRGHRDAPAAFQGREIPRSRAAGGGRRATIRRGAQRAPEGDAQERGRADHVGDADSANAAHVAGGAARHERDRDAAEGPARDSDDGRAVQRDAGAAGDRGRVGTRGAGFLRAQPSRVDRVSGIDGEAAWCRARVWWWGTARCARPNSKK